ncbi:MAG: hypothetical protein J1F42_15225, partial [Lachnospiraceae bacterium]|nr:hypothetical protein [Lachnospiraceae bacterium]
LPHPQSDTLVKTTPNKTANNLFFIIFPILSGCLKTAARVLDIQYTDGEVIFMEKFKKFF